MSTTRVRPTAAVVAALVGVLALGACGDRGAADTDTSEPSVTEPDAAEPDVAEPEDAEAEVPGADEVAAAAAAAQAEAEDLRQLRLTHPTAGTDVPPATLLARMGDGADQGAADDGVQADQGAADDGADPAAAPRARWLELQAE